MKWAQWLWGSSERCAGTELVTWRREGRRGNAGMVRRRHSMIDHTWLDSEDGGRLSAERDGNASVGDLGSTSSVAKWTRA
ncbi:hypothetical protein U1Q18_005201 [Sarracenia purpurea var. burkii]